MTFDLTAPGVLKIISARIKEEIDEFAENEYDDGLRWHLGVSKIGEACKRKLWFHYRWAEHHKFNGRMQRLFQRGHLEELRYHQYLEGIGFEVHKWNAAPVYELVNGLPILVKKAEQIKVSWLNGHFGGSTDGVIKLPVSYGIPDYMVAEYKTNSTGKGFNDLQKGVAKAKPIHHYQMCTYGLGLNLHYSAYFNTNKNDDDLYVEITALDHNIGHQMVRKAEEVILSQEAPARISENPTYEDCRFCDYKDICHNGKTIQRNCRSCIHAVPVEHAEFYCNDQKGIIPRDFVPKGCGNYSANYNNSSRIISIHSVVKPENTSEFEILDNEPIPK